MYIRWKKKKQKKKRRKIENDLVSKIKKKKNLIEA